MNVESICTK
jgi:hypothetical protein